MAGYCVMRLRSKINFGKHKEKQVSEILESDPSYLAWCLNNHKLRCSPSKELINKLIEKGFKVDYHEDRKHHKCIVSDN